ncbi:hypothetical protein P154DRAFT_251128 [Amniculicola lignicola CBS 123094]|uniref:Uncharacterized protein n=1 Tax=Amniculicola lignicola CBS 123094 TaxID=1392246 RepID=A0A6A5WB84_9PLEO|nr:hypothetical protein P154DRAFT_251128 [Amniculicola lignicola CBS 123094]
MKKLFSHSQHGGAGEPASQGTAGLSGEGTHLTGASGGTDSHPIYDQFTKPSGEPGSATGNTPHFSNTADVRSAEGTTHSPSSVRQDSTLRPGQNVEAMSTASIKSGVLGFGQGKEEHAARDTPYSATHHAPTGEIRQEHATPGNDYSEDQNREFVSGQTEQHLLDQNSPSEQSSHLGRDTGLGAGAGSLAAHEYSSRREKNVPKTQTQQYSSQTPQRSYHEPEIATESDRSFPLAGGITGRRHDDTNLTNKSTGGLSSKRAGEDSPCTTNTKTSDFAAALTGENASHGSTANTGSVGDRELGTKDRETGDGVHDSRKGLAGAAGAAGILGAAAAHRQHESKQDPGQSAQAHASSGLPTMEQNTRGLTAPNAASDQRSLQDQSISGLHTDQSGPRDHALSGLPTEDRRTPEPEKRSSYSGLLFTTGPHVTDTANRTDPHLHIPGEFPEPTPLDEPAQPTFETPSPGGAITDGLSDPTAPPTEHSQNKDEHHFGRDAAFAGGAGAVGLGGHGTGKHHQRETTDIGGENLQTSPYSSSKIDPRVDGKTGRLDPTARSEPSASNQHHGRDAATVGGLAGGAGLAGYEASEHRPAAQENIPPTTTPHQQIPQSYSQTQNESQESQHRYGRDASLVGASAATAGGLYYANQRGEDKPQSGPATETIGSHKSNVANVLDPRVQPDPALQRHHETGPTPIDPATATVGPHKSNAANIVDPRVQPEPEKMKGHITAGPHHSDTLNKADPNVDTCGQSDQSHHYGRDAAFAGGAGATGVGAFEAAKMYGEHRSTQSSASMNEQRYDPTAPGAHAPNPTQTQSQHHYGRDAAVGGGALAAGAGTAAYLSSRDQPSATEGYQQPSATQGYQQLASHGYQQPAAQGYQQPSGQSYQQQSTDPSHQRFDSVQDPSQQSHNKLNIATASAAGVAGAGTAYGLSQHEQEKAEKERLAKLQKDQDKVIKDHEKKQAHDQKHANKVAAAEDKHLHKEMQKDAEKAQKKIEKEEAKAEKKHEKKEAKAEKNHEKEEDSGKKKRHSLLGFLHRDKKKSDADSGSDSGSPRHSKEYAATGAGAGAGLAGAAAYEAEQGNGHDRNRLHKDPPPGHPAREAMEQQSAVAGGKHEHRGIDGPIGDPNLVSGDHTTRHNVYGAHEPDEQNRTVIEPHTGLPMNVGKYGDGKGGTDGSNTVDGFHEVQANERVPKENVTNSKEIQKTNMLY